MPSHLYEIIKGDKSTLPQVAIASSDGSKGITGFAAKGNTTDSVKKLAREIRKQLRDDPTLLIGSSQTGEETDSESAGGPLIASRKWTNIQGKAITAAVLSVDDLNVVFELPNGKTTSYPLANLSEHSQALIKEMAE